MVPARFVRLETLPLTPNGKLDRRALAPAMVRSATARMGLSLPQNALEHQLLLIWQEILGIEEIGMDDGFFDLGGSSATLVQVHARLCQMLGVRLSITRLFQYPTIRSLAQALGREIGAADALQKAQDRARQSKEALARRRQAAEELRR